MKHLTFIFLTLFLAVSAVSPLRGNATTTRGDVNNDGTIDGKDALKIILILEGRMPSPEPSDAFWVLSDVYPLPGTEGRVMGDGQVTIEDAYKILRNVAGLIPEGEITGDFSGSPPRIDGIEPAHGPEGSEVTIHGENFVMGSPTENIVLFGELLASVLSSTGTTLVTEAPVGVNTDLIRVITPGGEAVSPVEFTVTIVQSGQLTPPQGSLPTDYQLVNYFGDEAQPAVDGSFSIPTHVSGVNTPMALPKDDSDRILLSLNITGSTGQMAQTADETSMSLLSTAQAFVFLTPYFATPNPELAQRFASYIREDPKVVELAQVLEQLYEETPEPFDDQRFREAYKTAIESVIERLPEELVVDLSTQTQMSAPAISASGDIEASRMRVMRAPAANGEPWVANWEEFYPDRAYTYADISNEPGVIPPNSLAGNPVDWLVHLAEVKDIYDTFPSGEASIVSMEPMSVLPRDREGIEDLTFIPSNSYLKYIDFFGTLFNLVWGEATDAMTSVFPSLSGVASPDGNLHVDPNRDAVYVVRVFSGALGDRPDPGEFDFVWDQLPDGEQNLWIAIGFNSTMAAIDFASMFIDVKAVAGATDKGLFRQALRTAFRKGIRLATRKVPKGTVGLSSGEKVKIILSIVYAATQDITSVIAADLAEVALKKRVSILMKKLGESIDIGYKLSMGSQAVERAIALLGKKHAKSISPLETWVLVVGYPFRPTVEEIIPEEASLGEEVTLLGKSFDFRNAQNNEVRLGAIWHEAKVAKVLSVSADGTQLTFQVPHDQTGGWTNIWIKTPYSGPALKQMKQVLVKRVPKLRAISRDFGFGPGVAGPFAGDKGTQVILKGISLKPSEGAPADRVFFGGVEATVEYVSFTEVWVRVPSMSPGQVQLYIDSPEYGEESNRVPFTVMGPPSLFGIAPSLAMAGQYLEASGSNFGYNIDEIGASIKLLSVSNNNKLSLQMPTGGEPGAKITVTVWTPAGSASGTVTREEGVEVPEPHTYTEGYILNVTDTQSGIEENGEISLDEALAFASGEEDPTDPKWDDEDEIVIEKWVQVKLDEVFFKWKKKGQRTMTGRWEIACGAEWFEDPDPENDDGFFHEVCKFDPVEPEGTRRHEQRHFYREDYYHEDDPVHGFYAGRPVGPYRVGEQESLDSIEEEEDNREEADRIRGEEEGGPLRADLIKAYGDVYYQGGTVELGAGDRLEGDRILVGQISLPGNATLIMQHTVNASKIVIEGDNNIIQVGEIEEGTLTLWNGITIREGFGNSIKSTYSNIDGGTYGIHIDGGGANEVSVGATISGVSGNGVHIDNGEENSVRLITIESASGDGIFIEGGRGNSVAFSTVEGAGYGIHIKNSVGNSTGGNAINNSKSGIYIDGGDNNVVGAEVEGNGRHGIELRNTRLNKINPYVDGFIKNNGGDGIHMNLNSSYNTVGYIKIENNGGSGIYIGGGSSYNRAEFVSHDNNDEFISVMGNRDGVVISGSGSAHNILYANIGVTHIGDVLHVSGNSGDGAVISNGAHDNFLSARIHGSGQNGVLITGEGTDRNTISYSKIGAYTSEDVEEGKLPPNVDALANAGDGVRIADGASDNLLDKPFIALNGGNGITIEGQNTDSNRIEEGVVGGLLGEPPPDVYPHVAMGANQGIGILISDSPVGTLVSNVDMGVNLSGGIKLAGIAQQNPPDDEAPLATLEQNEVGRYNSGRPVDGTKGTAIHLENCTDILLKENKVSGHDVGISISGSESKRNFVDYAIVDKTSGQGLLVEDSENDKIYLRVSNAGDDGILLRRAEGTIFGERIGDGIYKDFHAEANAGSGVHIEGSQNIVVSFGTFLENTQHGILIDAESNNVSIIAPYSQRNKGAGIYLHESDFIRIEQAATGEIINVQNNEANGIVVEESQEILVSGRPNLPDEPPHKVDSISNNEPYGILITGDQAANVTVTGIGNIGENGEAGIRIDGGSNIRIGGPKETERNSLGGSPAAITAQGTETDVSIINNFIGGGGFEPLYNDIGIEVRDDISEVRIAKNRIDGNHEEGILLWDGAQHNLVEENTIINNAVGVRVKGATTLLNNITNNSITGNMGKGIDLTEGGNNMVDAPVIDEIAWRAYNVAGTVNAPAGSLVELYADSADEGEQILGASSAVGHKFYISTDVPSGLNLHAIVIHPDGNTSEFGPTMLSPSMGTFAFASTRDGNQEIYFTGPGQDQSRQITDRPSVDHSPKLSPNPEHILFVSDESGNFDLWMVRTNGSDLTQVTQNPTADFDPAWSPDGSKIAFVSEGDGNAEIYTMQMGVAGPSGELAYDDGGSEWTEYSGVGDIYGVHFTTQGGGVLSQTKFYIAANPAEFEWMVMDWGGDQPGDTVLAQGNTTPAVTGWHVVDVGDVQVPQEFFVGLRYVQSNQPGLGVDKSGPTDQRSFRYFSAWEIWSDYGGADCMVRAVMQVEIQRLTDNLSVDQHPAYSPDGTKIAFTSERDGNPDIWVMNSDGTELQRLTDNPSPDYNPAWSPDGSKIAFVSERDGNPEIYLMEFIGGNLTRLTEHTGVDIAPVWNPDGGDIIFSSDRDSGMELYSIRPDGHTRRLTSSLGDNTQPDTGFEKK